MIHFLKFFARIYNRLFSKEKVFIKRLRGLIGFTPANLGIFKLAFYHKSTTSDKLYAIQSNERLEYLGDAVLATIVAEYLFQKYPNSDEGFLTKMRSKIVKRYSLNVIADKMGLDVFLNQYNNTRLSRSMLGNALEALVGAVYLEKGYNATRKFVINRILLGYLDIHELESYDDNYKSQLLEWCQKNGKTVSYKMVSKYKFEKRDRFKVAVLIDGEKLAVADDFNKKSAEQTASERAMQILGILEVKDEKKDGQRGRKKPQKFKGKERNSGGRNRGQSPDDRKKSEQKNRTKKDRPADKRKPERSTEKSTAPKEKRRPERASGKSDTPVDKRKSERTTNKSDAPTEKRRPERAVSKSDVPAERRRPERTTNKSDAPLEKRKPERTANKSTRPKKSVEKKELTAKSEDSPEANAPKRNPRRTQNTRTNRAPRRNNSNPQNRNAESNPESGGNPEPGKSQEVTSEKTAE